MKKLLLSVAVMLYTVTGIAQFKALEKLNKSGNAYMYSNNEEVLKGNISSQGKPFIAVWTRNGSQQGKYQISMSLMRSGYSYDTSGNDRNYISIDVIPDGNKSAMVTFEAEIYNDKGNASIKNQNELFQIFRNARVVYLRTRVGDRVNNVIKIPASNFLASYKQGVALLDQKSSNDPFDTPSDDPFNR